MTLLARIGFGARGLVYLMIGWFAIDAALHGGQPSDNQGVLGSLADSGLGRLLLFLCAVGFAGYALWRLTEAALDPEQRSHDMKGRLERAGYALSGVVHAMLAVAAVNLALRIAPAAEGSPGDRTARSWSSWLLDQPGGQAALVVAGVVLVVVALAQAIKAYQARFDELAGDVPAPQQVRWAGRLGYAARAIVFAMMGWFVINAALHENAREAGGLGAALRQLRDQEQGPLLLGIVAVGLALFGLFSLVEAAYRHLRIDRSQWRDVAARARR
ncbi:MAG TPA: DUF1206 domain-containing protein [Sphingobium sp.]|nr:DUF1206 domain-containing protein [Sphingobium sp.]